MSITLRHTIFRLECEYAHRGAVSKTFRDSSTVEQRPVKALVASSNLAPGALDRMYVPFYHDPW